MSNARSRILEDLTVRLLIKMYCVSDGTGSVGTVFDTGPRLEFVNLSHSPISVRLGLA